jgi:hypothetical protein
LPPAAPHALCGRREGRCRITDILKTAC